MNADCGALLLPAARPVIPEQTEFGTLPAETVEAAPSPLWPLAAVASVLALVLAATVVWLAQNKTDRGEVGAVRYTQPSVPVREPLPTAETAPPTTLPTVTSAASRTTPPATPSRTATRVAPSKTATTAVRPAAVSPPKVVHRLSYPSFDDPSGIALNGAATPYASVLLLTEGADQAGSAWSTTAVDPAKSFSTSFRVQMPYLTDGIAFVIQSQGLGALGMAGGGLGYGADLGSVIDVRFAPRIAPSLAIEFDTWDNSPDGYDHLGVDHHVAVIVNGDMNRELGWAEPASSLVGPSFVGWVDYDAPARTLKIYVSRGASRPTTPILWGSKTGFRTVSCGYSRSRSIIMRVGSRTRPAALPPL